MQIVKSVEQHIAVFGESGSGKTVLVSSFYGAAQEPQYSRDKPWRVIANDAGQGGRLHSNYLGMRDQGRAPQGDKFLQTSYSFSMRFKGAGSGPTKKRPIDELRLVWHDYPGEWFESEASTPSEAQNQVDTFRSLLVSDVALLLVDAQRLLDHAGEEERYLKYLFANFKNGLLAKKDAILEKGKPLVKFPRIWVLALSKADLLPAMDVYAFRDLLVLKASGEMHELREVLSEFVVESDAFSLGEDFVLLSSAKFEPDHIDVVERVGVDLVLPMATMLPLERSAQWARKKQMSVAAIEKSLGVGAGAAMLGLALLNKVPLPGVIGSLTKLAAPMLSKNVLDGVVNVTTEHVKKLNSEAEKKHNALTQMLTEFKLQLASGESEHVLLRSES